MISWSLDIAPSKILETGRDQESVPKLKRTDSWPLDITRGLRICQLSKANRFLTGKREGGANDS